MCNWDEFHNATGQEQSYSHIQCHKVAKPEAMRVLKYHGDVGGAWLALDKAAGRFVAPLSAGLERIHYLGGLE